MHRSFPCSSLLALGGLLAASATAQTLVVIPAEAATAEGSGLSAAPFAYDRVRYSQYYGTSLLRSHIPYGRRISELWYRRDGRAFNTLLMRHTSTPTWEIRMGNYTGDPVNPHTRYLSPGSGAFNTLAPVFNKQGYVFPDLPGGTGPMSFRIKFPLDRPFVYLGGGLVVDHYVYETRNRSFTYYVDAVRKTPDTGSFVAYGVSCPKDANRASAIPTNPGGEPLTFLMFGAKPQTVAIMALGLSDKRWGPISLPLDLTPLGLKGCSIYASLDFLFAVGTYTTGQASLSMEVPKEPGLAGATFFSQWIVLDDQVNPAVPLTFSNGVKITLGKSVGKGAGIDAAAVYGVGNIARSTYGFLDRGVVLVTRFGYL